VLPRRDCKGVLCLGGADWLASEEARPGWSISHVIAGFHLREHVRAWFRRDDEPCSFVRDAQQMNLHYALCLELHRARDNVDQPP
jgi:hypothetical protein